MTITTSFTDGFQDLFKDIKSRRPDLNNNSEVAQEAVRELWKKLKSPSPQPPQDSPVVWGSSFYESPPENLAVV